MVREQQPWLDVPFAEKDEAKAAGALWDRCAKRWYAPRPGVPELERWLPVARTLPDGVPVAGGAEGAEAGPGDGSTTGGAGGPATGGACGPAADPADAARVTSGARDAARDASVPAVRPAAVPPAAVHPTAAHRAAAPPAAAQVGTEARLAEALRCLTEPGRLARLARRRPPWRVLHGVPANPRRDLDHVLVGPPGVVTVEVARHAGRSVAVDGDRLTVDGEVVDDVSRARVEAERVGRLLAAARDGGAVPPVTAALAVVAESVAVAPGRERPQGILVATPANLPRRITTLPTELADDEIDELYAVARRLGTWTREL